MLLLDIDHFKAINDNHGHDSGDAVIREFSQRLSSNVRSVDLVCRYGGEEFVVIMPETGMMIAGIVAERLRERIAAESFDALGAEGGLNVTVSIGISGIENPIDSPTNILRRADESLYRAKRTGRNRVAGPRLSGITAPRVLDGPMDS